METVFILHHSYEKEQHCEETKFIGVYSSEQKAGKAIQRLSSQPGFKDKTDDFQIGEYELNKDYWPEGFAVIVNIQTKDINGNWITVTAQDLLNGNYQIVEKYVNDLLGEFKDGDVIRCEQRDDGLYAIEKIKE